jgi:hypothetical protein
MRVCASPRSQPFTSRSKTVAAVEAASKQSDAQHEQVQAELEHPCWGCGSMPPSTPRGTTSRSASDFTVCQLCLEKNYAVCAHFCSQTCLKLHLQRHEAWHAKKDAELEKRLEVVQKSLEAEQERAEIYALNQLHSDLEKRRFEDYAARQSSTAAGCSDERAHTPLPQLAMELPEQTGAGGSEDGERAPSKQTGAGKSDCEHPHGTPLPHSEQEAGCSGDAKAADTARGAGGHDAGHAARTRPTKRRSGAAGSTKEDKQCAVQ